MIDVLGYAGSIWHVLTAFVVFVLGLLFAVAQKKVFLLGHRQAIFLYSWHTIACILYLQYSIHNVADANHYYLHSLTYVDGFGVGTAGVYYLTSVFSAGFGFSYFGVFLVYNIFGYIGMLACASALQDLTQSKGLMYRRVAWFLVLLPGLSFWSSAIGKDSISFMAAGLATWGVLNLQSRYFALVIAALLFLFVRPHMAGIFLTALAIAMLFSQRIKILKKGIFLVFAIPCAVVAVQYGAKYAGLGEFSSIDEWIKYFSERQGYNLEGGSSVDISEMSVSMRLLTYLYRPFFFDVNNMLALVVSVENLALLIVSARALVLGFLGRSSQLNTFAKVFFLVFSFFALFVLANSTANIGIAIRQKWMFMPMLLVLAMSVPLRRLRS